MIQVALLELQCLYYCETFSIRHKGSQSQLQWDTVVGRISDCFKMGRFREGEAPAGPHKCSRFSFVCGLAGLALPSLFNKAKALRLQGTGRQK